MRDVVRVEAHTENRKQRGDTRHNILPHLYINISRGTIFINVMSEIFHRPTSVVIAADAATTV